MLYTDPQILRALAKFIDGERLRGTDFNPDSGRGWYSVRLLPTTLNRQEAWIHVRRHGASYPADAKILEAEVTTSDSGVSTITFQVQSTYQQCDTEFKLVMDDLDTKLRAFFARLSDTRFLPEAWRPTPEDIERYQYGWRFRE